jgi:hypothetical protein
MNYHKLRIAWSFGWSILCLLLVALWVRSYNVPFSLMRPSTTKTESMGILSNRGWLSVGRFEMVTVTTDPYFAGLGQRLAQEQFQLANLDRATRVLSLRKVATIQRQMALYRTRFALVTLPPVSPARGSAIVVPHCFPLLLTATIAGAPWVNWRFSLRTLLVATTVVAMGLGLLVMMLKGN